MIYKIVLTLIIFTSQLNVLIGQDEGVKDNEVLVFPYAYTFDQSEDNSKYGLINEDNTVIVKPIFRHIEPFKNQYYNSYTTFTKTIKKGKELTGVISKKGDIIKGLIAEHLSYDDNGECVIIKQRKKETIINIITMDTISHSDTAHLIQVIVAKKKYFVMQHKRYDYFFFLSEEGQRISDDIYEFKLHHKWDIDGIPVFKTQFNYKNNRYVDPYGKSYDQTALKRGESIIPPRIVRPRVNNNISEESIIELVEKETLGYVFQEFYPGKRSFISMEKRGKLALANDQGQLITDCVYDAFIPLQTDFYNKGKYDTENYILCKKGDKVGLLNTDGKKLLAPIFDTIDFDFHSKLFYVIIGNYSGYCSTEGKVYLPKECNCY